MALASKLFARSVMLFSLAYACTEGHGMKEARNYEASLSGCLNRTGLEQEAGNTAKQEHCAVP